MSLPEDLAEPLARAGSRIGPFAGRLRWHAEVTSTNDVASVLAEHGADEGTGVIAQAQSAGRGRLGRTWASPPGAGLYVSVVLKPVPRVAPLLTLAAGVALVDAVVEATGLTVSLKWPNDLYAGRRKVAGILAEAGTAGPVLRHVVLGFGINVQRAAYPPDVARRATSLEEELGRPVDLGVLLATSLANLWHQYEVLSRGEVASLRDAWRRHAATWLGGRVAWSQDGTPRSGVAHDIDEGGALLVRTALGVERVIAGDVQWL